jgi:hypothetical protein
MSCENESQNSSPIRLTIQGIGHVPSFKNLKVIGRRGLYTKPRAKAWMQACSDSIALQLLCLFRISENATPTGRSRQSWIASYVPLDDSVREIVEERIRVEFVEAGQEGAEILIERLRTD